MAKTRRAQGRDRAAHPRARLRRARARPRAADLRRADVHADHGRRGVAAVRGRDDRGHPPDQGGAAGRARPRSASPTSPSASRRPRARSSTPSSCTTASRPGSTSRWSTRTTSRPTARSPRTERELADDLVFNRREDALERFIAHFEAKGAGEEAEAADPTEGMEPEEALHWHILRRKKDGVEDQIDARGREDRRRPDAQRRAAAGDEGGRRQVRRRRADPALRAPERRGHEARRRPARELPRQARGLHEGHGRARDRVRRRARHRQVARQHDPHQQRLHASSTSASRSRSATILDAAKEHDATAIGLSALLVSTSKQMPLCVQELHSQGLEYPVLIGGAAINRNFGLRALYPDGKESDDDLRARRLLLQGRVRGPGRDGPARRRRGARARSWRKIARGGPPAAREGPRARGRADTTDDSVRSAARTDDAGARAAVLGRARDPRRPRRGLPPPRHARAVQAALGRPRREGRGVARARRRGLPAAPGAHVARAGLPAPARAARLLPLLLRGQRDRRARPRGPRDGARAARLPAPAQGRPHLPGRLLPPEGAAASSTSSRSRPSPPATRSPS